MQILRFPGHYWRSNDELAIDLILWQPHHGKQKRGRPAKTYTSINLMYTSINL